MVVRYMKYRGTFPARDYFRGACSPVDRARFIALAKQLSIEGKLPGSAFGHFLKGKYSQIFELKPTDSRFFGFFVDTQFYVTNAAKKCKPKQQEADYERALAMRDDFLRRLIKARSK